MPQQSTSDVNTSVLANRPAVESTPPGARERLLEVRLKPLEAGSDGASVKRRQHASWDAPLSNSQLGLWLLDRFAGQGSGSNIARATVVQGDLDVSALERSVLTLIQRHESLRTAIEHRDGVAVQRVMTADQASREFSLTPLPIDGGSATESSGKLNALLQSLADIPFDLERAPLLRAHLLQLGETEHVFLLVVHHFVFDAWSMSVLARELRVLYAAGGRATTLPSLPIQFADYAVWQHEKLADGALSGHAEYWRAKLSGLAPLELPTDRPRPARLSQSGGKVRFEIEAAQLGQLKALARRENASLFMVLLSAFQVLLMRCSGQHDLAVGVPTAGRDQVELHGLMGPFANTLVLRSDLSGNPGFTELLGRVRQTALDAFDNQDLPFGQLVAEISPERDPSRNPLFQVGFELQSTPEGNIGLDGLQTRRIDFQRTTPVHDLTLSVTESDGVLRGTFEYATDLFDGSSIERMARHWRTLLGGVAAISSGRLTTERGGR